jgi:hypothetical protein
VNRLDLRRFVQGIGNFAWLLFADFTLRRPPAVHRDVADYVARLSPGILGFPFNPLNAELNPICHLLALLGAHPILNVSRIRVNYNLVYASCSFFRHRLVSRWGLLEAAFVTALRITGKEMQAQKMVDIHM